MVLARRAVAVFLAAFGLMGLFFYPSSCRSTGFSSHCEFGLWLKPWAWLFAGSLLLVAGLLWSAPWRRLRTGSIRTYRPSTPVRSARRLDQVGGWLLLGMGGAVVFYSIAGLFRSAPDCSWELGCYEFDFYGDGAFREAAFSRIRVIGVTFGASLLWWGFLELQLEVERVLRVVLVGLGLGVFAMVVADPLGYGFTGFGAVQVVGIVGVLALMALVVLTRERVPRLRELLVRSQSHRRDLLLAAMSLSIILGAWTTVLALVEPNCSGLVRCEGDLRPVSVLAVAVVAAGLYLALARWQSAASQPNNAPPITKSTGQIQPIPDP